MIWGYRLLRFEIHTKPTNCFAKLYNIKIAVKVHYGIKITTEMCKYDENDEN